MGNSKVQASDPEWKTEKTNLLTFRFRMCSLSPTSVKRVSTSANDIPKKI